MHFTHCLRQPSQRAIIRLITFKYTYEFRCRSIFILYMIDLILVFSLGLIRVCLSVCMALCDDEYGVGWESIKK